MIATARLRLRPWREDDRQPFRAMARDPEVMRYLPPVTAEQSDRTVDRMMAMQAEHGHCLWAVERSADQRFLGFCGILAPRSPTFEHEIGWRLERSAWGQGYASEAARASLGWVWANLDTATVVAITVPDNRRSRAVMERIGMRYEAGGDFDHPDLAEGDPLRRHVLYRIGRPK